MTERIENIKIKDLVPFENHPFKTRSGIEQEELSESIKSGGLLTPIIVRPFSDGKYEIISGHRRVEVCKELGIDTIPAIVKELTNEEAVIAMVDANLQRENLLPSEKAFAYKTKMDALKHQGKTCGQFVHKSRDTVSESESGRQVQRYIRLTHLIPELLKPVDEGRIALTPAVELSYIPEHEQRMIADEVVSKFAPYFEINETPFVIKIGKTTYEVSTHFSIKGKETVLGQFKELLTELNIA